MNILLKKSIASLVLTFFILGMVPAQTFAATTVKTPAKTTVAKSKTPAKKTVAKKKTTKKKVVKKKTVNLNPPLITLETAPHSEKPAAKKKTTKKKVVKKKV